jgi:hypothetical protein
MSQCLKEIKSDSKAHSIYHENHVLSTTVLKHGWKKYQQQHNIKL